MVEFTAIDANQAIEVIILAGEHTGQKGYTKVVAGHLQFGVEEARGARQKLFSSRGYVHRSKKSYLDLAKRIEELTKRIKTTTGSTNIEDECPLLKVTLMKGGEIKRGLDALRASYSCLKSFEYLWRLSSAIHRLAKLVLFRFRESIEGIDDKVVGVRESLFRSSQGYVEERGCFRYTKRARVSQRCKQEVTRDRFYRAIKDGREGDVSRYVTERGHQRLTVRDFGSGAIRALGEKQYAIFDLLKKDRRYVKMRTEDLFWLSQAAGDTGVEPEYVRVVFSHPSYYKVLKLKKFDKVVLKNAIGRAAYIGNTALLRRLLKHRLVRQLDPNIDFDPGLIYSERYAESNERLVDRYRARDLIIARQQQSINERARRGMSLYQRIMRICQRRHSAVHPA